MALFKPDQSFYPSPRMAMQAPSEKLAYVAALSPTVNGKADAMTVVDIDPDSNRYGQIVGTTELPYAGDELHHFGWNACSSALCPYAAHPHMERRYLVVPGLRSSRIYIMDIKSNPRKPEIIKVIEPEEVFERSNYSRLHTVHCGPEGIYVGALGAPNGDGPGGVLLLDHDSFEVLGQWEMDRGPQYLSYDFWWHLGHDAMITSEWGTPKMVEDGLIPERLLNGEYGHQLHFWDLRKRCHVQAVDLGAEQQIVLELRAAHDPTKAYGFAGVVLSLKDLSASVFLWHQNNGGWDAQKVIEIPAEPASEEDLPPALKPFKAVPPLVTDINLSLDDKFLYVSCWGTGEMQQYDVSDPFNPKKTGSVRLGGIVNRTPHPKNPNKSLNGAPQMVEVSKDGKRVYFTNSLYRSWDDQFYPDGIESWMAKLDVNRDGGINLDPDFFVEFDGYRAHQIRLENGDCSSDSFCYS
ncbi:MAG: selenium-binding protein [candidate division Zixibacteria bacterium]|nr:selenium-binding protein [candidate division Zixibacteria bacterium]NIW43264.1 selenium-binding protein [Gammaproteobacteria bacterium]NIX54397.1 selenium-binding protein [candidate division Zixibacteria bacterium]